MLAVATDMDMFTTHYNFNALFYKVQGIFSSSVQSSKLDAWPYPLQQTIQKEVEWAILLLQEVLCFVFKMGAQNFSPIIKHITL